MSTSIDNALTIDVEDYFQVHAFSNVIRYQDWANYECRIERNTYAILEILDNANVPNRSNSPAIPTHHSSLITQNSTKATFFILGWIAERYPGLVREIAAQGHEVASHGYRHELVGNQSPSEFQEDIVRTKKILEDIIGAMVIGYRASTYSITKKTSWALRSLAQEGYRYDSSIFPIYHDVYGFPEAPRFPFKVNLNGYPEDDVRNVQDLGVVQSVRTFKRVCQNEQSNTSNESNTSNNSASGGSDDSRNSNSLDGPNTLWEFPISTVRFLGQNLPVAGGGYFRLFPYSLVKRLLRHINGAEQKPFVFYLHPWELDPDQPRIGGAPLKSRFRQYLNLDKVEGRFRKLLSDFRFAPIRDLIVSYGEHSAISHRLSAKISNADR